MTPIIAVFKFANHLGEVFLQTDEAEILSNIFRNSNIPVSIGVRVELKIEDNINTYEIININVYPYFRFNTTEEYVKNATAQVNTELFIYVKQVEHNG